MAEDVTYKQYSDLVQKVLETFIRDMRELGQTEISASGPGYQIDLTIEPKDPQ